MRRGHPLGAAMDKHRAPLWGLTVCQSYEGLQTRMCDSCGKQSRLAHWAVCRSHVCDDTEYRHHSEAHQHIECNKPIPVYLVT